MAQTNFTPISLYYSSVSGHTPTAGNLVAGELAINTNDGLLFYKDSGGTVQVLASKATGTVAGSTTQVIYNNAGAYAGSANMTFNGTSLTLANDASIHGLTVGLGAGSVSSNTAVGGSALSANTTGSNNTAVGKSALSANTTGLNNTAVGGSALSANTTGLNNTAVGYASSQATTTGTQNTAVGDYSLYSNSVGSFNSAFGGSALQNNTADANSAFGQGALYLNTSGTNNSALGLSALNTNTTGSSNVAVGVNALQSNTTAPGNTAVGYQAGYSNTTGQYNCIFGYNSGYSNTVSSNNVFYGLNSGFNFNGASGATYNTFIGPGAGYYVTTGTNNTILGGYSGNQSGLDIRTASNYIVLSDGAGNPRGIYDNNGNYIVGTTGVQSQNASDSTGFSIYGSGSASSLIGATTICRDPGTSLLAVLAVNNKTAGNTLLVQWYSGGSAVGSVTSNGTGVTYATLSDYRLKEDVQPMQDALATVAQLNPVTYKWKTDGSDGQGFIAHELQAVVPECVTGEKDAVDEDGNPVYQGIDTSFLVATLTKAIQELSAKNDALEARIIALENK